MTHPVGWFRSRMDYIMLTDLDWIEGPWRGRLAIMPRPRGADWVEDEIQALRSAEGHGVLSLLTFEEQTELNLDAEEELCRSNGIEFLFFPIEDRGIPASSAAFSDLLAKLAEQLAGGKNIAIHCRQGIGRAALAAIGV